MQGLIFCKIRYIDENFPMIMAEFILHKNHKCCKPIGTYKFIKLLKFLAPMALKNSTIRPKVGKILGNLFNWILLSGANWTSLLDYHFKTFFAPYSHFFHPTRLGKFYPTLLLGTFFLEFHPTRFHFPSYLISKFSTLLVYLALLFSFSNS